MTAPQSAFPRPAGWYPDDHGVTRFWDGVRWTEHTAPPPPPGQQPAQPGYPQFPPPVFVQPNVRQARDRAQYTRQQQGHSLMKHLLFGWMLGYVPTIYYAISPNHYFHA